MKLVRLVKADRAIVKQINGLLLQLAHNPAHARSVSLPALRKIIKDENVVVMAARDGEKIVGMATLITIRSVSEFYGEIGDVVVDEIYRGQGLGKMLMKAIIEKAKKMKVRIIKLSTRPSRTAANMLYQKLGFKQKETNVYRLEL